jgi:GNAT superfamily N-acetyltransferase
VSSLAVSVYSPEHVYNLVRMWRAGFERGVGIKDPHPLEAQLGYFHEKVLPNHRVRLAWQDETLVGFLAANHESVAQLDARLGYHREGMGSHRLPLILPLAKRDPASSLWLYTFQQMVVAKRFYERHGFTAVEFGFEPNWQLADVKYQWVKGVIGAFDR